MLKPHSFLTGLAFLILGLASPLMGGDAPSDQSEHPRFGPFEALVFDQEYLQDVKFEDGRIYLKRQPNHRKEAITLRNSMANRDAYRKWFNDKTDLVSPANAGHPENAWTDWVETSANYVEYWVGERMILHLHRVDR